MNDGILETYLSRTPGSRALHEQAESCIAGGIVTDTRRFDPYGIYVTHGAGARKWDVDGNCYLDFFGGHGACMMGHSFPSILAAASDALAKGTQFAANGPSEVALARKVVDFVETAELVRFCGSGTEATLLAIRLARAFTGRPRILRITSNYHGWHDQVASGYNSGFDGSPSPGVLKEVALNTILVPPNDKEALARAFEQYGQSIACCIAEPLGTHFGVVPTDVAFLQALEGYARDAGALFILDEVLSGFRVSLHGAQHIMGLTPDITTFAKALCGGLPGGAVAGRKDIMGQLDFSPEIRKGRAKVMHQGTFTGNPVSMAAGLAMLEALEARDACGHVNRLGAYAREQLNAAAEAERLPFHWYGDYSIFHLLVKNDQEMIDGVDMAKVSMDRLISRPAILNRFRMSLNNIGFDVNTKCSGLISGVMSSADVDSLVNAVPRAFHMADSDQKALGHAV